jgi:hypothetical protein
MNTKINIKTLLFCSLLFYACDKYDYECSESGTVYIDESKYELLDFQLPTLIYHEENIKEFMTVSISPMVSDFNVFIKITEEDGKIFLESNSKSTLSINGKTIALNLDTELFQVANEQYIGSVNFLFTITNTDGSRIFDIDSDILMMNCEIDPLKIKNFEDCRYYIPLESWSGGPCG